MSNIDDQVKAKRAELKVLDDVIAEREDYRKQQETLINELTESGNSELMSLNHDILLAKQELKNLKVDIRTIKRDKVQATEDLELIRQDIQDEINGGMALGFA